MDLFACANIALDGRVRGHRGVLGLDFGDAVLAIPPDAETHPAACEFVCGRTAVLMDQTA